MVRWHQLVDVAVAVLLLVVVFVPLSLLDPGLGTRIGLVLACAYYFSRNPWGRREDGESVNRRVDALYDRYLPLG